jgi:hypothetical protein
MDAEIDGEQRGTGITIGGKPECMWARSNGLGWKTMRNKDREQVHHSIAKYLQKQYQSFMAWNFF